MRFERVKEEIKKDSKVHKLIDEFIKTNYDRVEVINEEDYADNKRMTAPHKVGYQKLLSGQS